MSDKRKWPREEAGMVGLALVCELMPACEPDRILICGSIRRNKAEVGDIEIVYVSKRVRGADIDWFAPPSSMSVADQALAGLFERCVIDKRKNVKGSESWGEWNKLAVHNATGIPVDFFATTEEAWWNYVVCRTGGAISNTQIAAEAKSRGWKWNPTRAGFSRRSGPDRGRVVPMHSEREVFDFVKLPYKEPWERL